MIILNYNRIYLLRGGFINENKELKFQLTLNLNQDYRDKMIV
jgi:hypothetical protein